MSFDWGKYNGFKQANIRLRSGEEIIREKERKHLQEMMGGKYIKESFEGTNHKEPYPGSFVPIMWEEFNREVDRANREITKAITGQSVPSRLRKESNAEYRNRLMNELYPSEYESLFPQHKRPEESVVLPGMKIREQVRSFFGSSHFGKVGYISDIYSGYFNVTFEDDVFFGHGENSWCKDYFPVNSSWLPVPKMGMHLKYKSYVDGKIYEGIIEHGVSKVTNHDYFVIREDDDHGMQFSEEDFESRWMIDIWPSRLRDK